MEKIIIAVDANIILSALLGGKPSIILFDDRFRFATAKFTLEEVKKYFPKLTSKLGVFKENLFLLLNKLPLEIYPKEFYQDKLKMAKKLIGHIDKKDAEILALALKLEAFIWTHDKHFEKSGYKKLLKTFDFIS